MRARPVEPVEHRALPTGRRMPRAVHAEWTKLRTVAGPGWLLLAAAAATVLISAAAAAAIRCPAAGCSADPARVSLAGVQAGQVVVAGVAVLVISGEYSTGQIGVTLTAMPRRASMLAAKAAVLAAVVLVTGICAVAGSLLTGRLILPGHGFTAAHGFPPLSLADGAVLRAAAGSVLYLTLIALLSLGAATAVRDSAAAIGVILALLYLFPVLAHFVDQDWQRHLQQIAPMTAGLAIQSTTGLPGLPISPWAGLAVTAAWAAGALLAGGLLLACRDA
jgi:ABC-2 type transport system permease protein